MSNLYPKYTTELDLTID